MASISVRMEWEDDKSYKLTQKLDFTVTDDERVNFGLTVIPQNDPLWEAEWSMTIDEARQMIRALAAILE